MNESPDSASLLVFALWGLPSLFLIGWMLYSVRHRGGRVQTQMLGLPVLLMAFFLAGLFGLSVLGAGKAAAGGAKRDKHAEVAKKEAPAATEPGDGNSIDPKLEAEPEGGSKQMSAATLWVNVIFFLGLVGIILGMLWYRRISIVDFFGLRNVHPIYAFLSGASIVLATFPILATVGQLIQNLMQESAHEQEVVTMIREVAKSGGGSQFTVLFLMAVLFQPVVEEVIFRGYLYPTFKGWAGMGASAVTTSVLFAAVHGNVAALPPLLILALVLTLAYEWTGSILVPISMHMAFNGFQLMVLKWTMEKAAS